MNNRGMAVYFYDERICLWKDTIEFLKNPKYIHLLIDEKNKHLFIRPAEKRDNDTFRIIYSQFDDDNRYRISSKRFVKYLAALIGVKFPSNSLWFEGYFLEGEDTVLINLNHYHITDYRNDEER